MTYSLDFRKKVLAVRKRENLSMMEVGERFDVGVASVMRWSKELEPKKTRNKAPTKCHNELLLKDVEQFPDAYHYERAQRLGVGRTTIGQALRRLGITYKKNLRASKSSAREKNHFH